jgi:glycosyltransferase involved in cell wall biosynthesis
VKIVFITVGYPPLQTGGAEAQARLQALELIKNGHSVLVISRSEKLTPRIDTIEGVRVIRLPLLRIRIVGTLLHLFSMFCCLLILVPRYDLIHVHLANLNADVAVLVGKIMRKPVYVKLASGGKSGEIFRFRKLSTLTNYYGLRNADRVQAISSEIHSEALLIGISQHRLTKIPNGVIIPKFENFETSRKQYARELRSSLNLPKISYLFLYLGRIAAYKGIADLLAAWDKSTFGNDVYLLIVGPTALDQPFEINRDRANVLVLGNKTDTLPFLMGSDCFVLPSHGEGMSNALLEAISFKIPVISTNVGASDELLSFGLGGRLIEPHNPSQLSEAMKNAKSNPNLSKELAEFSHHEIEKKYNIGSVSSRIIEQYHKLLEAR